LHAATFPALENLASGRVSPEDLAVAAIDELLRRRRDGHTFWLMPQTRKRARSTSRSPRTFGMIMTDVPPLTVAAVRPCGPAQRAGLHRGCKMLTINGQPAAHLRRFAA
jgi:C-terminal processing protease CtpA/Prc